MEIACLDLEGVLVPEIWIEFANKTGIEELKATTRDIPDYDVLMKQRLRILDEHGLKLQDIQEVIATLKPLDGAIEFVDWLRERFQVIILSDTFYEFSQPLMRDRKSTRLNSSHVRISYAVFCLKKKNKDGVLLWSFLNLCCGA